MKLYPKNNQYIVYPDGKIFSKISNRILNTITSKYGYLYVTIDNKKVSVHKLVASTYLPNLENKKEINHKDGDKTNNHVSNLEWVTSKENKKHAWELGLYTHQCENHHRTDLTEQLVRSVCERLQDGARNIDVAKEFNISKETVANIKSKRVWKSVVRYYNFSVKRQARKSRESVIKVCSLMEKGLEDKDIQNLMPNFPKWDIVRIRSGKIFKDIVDQFNIPESKYTRITEDLVNSVCILLSSGDSVTNICKRYNISKSVVSKIKNRKSWTSISKDYKW